MQTGATLTISAIEAAFKASAEEACTNTPAAKCTWLELQNDEENTSLRKTYYESVKQFMRQTGTTIQSRVYFMNGEFSRLDQVGVKKHYKN